MNVSLVTSLHLHHGQMSPDAAPGDLLPMQSFVPVGLLALKAYADRVNPALETRVTEINGLVNQGAVPNDDDFYEHIVDLVLHGDDGMVGLMTDADSLHHTLLIARAVKRRRPDVYVCLGGPASSPMSRELLDRFEFVDFVVRGEGELTLVELIDALQRGAPLAAVRGLSWRRGETAVLNLDRPVVEDLDGLPVPAFDHYDMGAGAPLYLDVGRGCPFKCHFCATAPFWDRKYRMKSIDRIVEEMVLVRELYGRDHVNFSHDIFTCDREWTKQFCDRLMQEPLGITWSCSTRTDVIDPHLLALMAEAGCDEIYYGIETGSQRLQKEIHKGLDLEWSREIVRATQAVGIRPVTGFILGYPFETRETLRDTLHRFFEFLAVGRFRAHIFTLCPFHESPMFREHGSQAVDRPAESYDLPLTPAAAAAGDGLTAAYPEIFTSLYRYSTPEVPAALIDASEELSPRLVAIRSLWPRLLTCYESPLEWYEGWVSWIAARNEQRGPGRRFRHQGETADLLEFLAEDLERRGVRDAVLLDLLRYEKLKQEARRLPSPAMPRQRGRAPLRADGTVMRRCQYIAEEFDRDLRDLLTDELAQEDEANGEGEGRRWVLFARTEEDSIDTLQVRDLAKRLLDVVDRPLPVHALVERLAPPDPFRSQPDPSHAVLLLESLRDCGLLAEVSPR